MRHLNTARGHHHRCTSTTKRLFAFMEGAAATPSGDIVGAVTLAATGSPVVGTDGWIGPNFRQYDGATMGHSGGGAGADAATLTANTWTIGIVVRRRASAAGVILCYGGNSGVAAGNVLARLKMATDGGLTFEWEDAGVVLRSVTIPTYKLVLNKWTYIHLVRTTATNVDVKVNGRKVASLNMTVANSGGTTSIWNVGMDEGAANKIQVDVNSLFLESVAMSAVSVYDDVRRAFNWAHPTSCFARLKIKDGLGAYRDMTAQEGYDWVDSIGCDEDVDSPCEAWTFNLAREHEYFSLANLVTSSKLNLTNVADFASYSPLVQVAREFLVEFARVPLNHTPAAADWVQRGHGFVDEVDWAGDGAVAVTGRDDGGKLVDDFIQSDLLMPITTGGACAADPTTGEKRGSTEEAIQDILNQVSSGAPPTLNAPSPANLCLIPWEQKKDSIMSAARAIAAVKAWDFAYHFDESPGVNTLKPTLIDPGRDRIDADAVVTFEDYASLQRANLSVFNVRNKVLVTYGDKNEVVEKEGGGGLVKAVKTTTSADAASKAKFGGFDRTMFVTEGDTSPIDESVEAQAMGDGILADLKDPTVEVSAPLNFCAFEAELYDIHTFVGDNVHWTGDQVLACTSLRLDYKEGAGTVSIGLRGKPSAGARRWLMRETRPGMENKSSYTTTERASHGLPLGLKQQLNDLIYRRSGVGRGSRVDLVRNGEFAMATMGSGFLPDGWQRASNDGSHTGPIKDGFQTTDANVTFEKFGAARSGHGYVVLPKNGNLFVLASDFFPVRGNRSLSLELVHILANNNGSNPSGVVEWYDENKAFISNGATVIGSPSTINIATIDDSGAGNLIQVTTAVAHGLAVGDVFAIDGTTNYQTLGVDGRALYVVGVVDSTVKVTATTASGGGLAAEAVGKFCRWQRSINTWFVRSPPTARYARFRVRGSTGGSHYYVDKVSLFEVSPEVRACLNNDITPVTDNAWTDIGCDIKQIDTEGVYDATTHTWTCPEDGIYEVKAALYATVTGAATYTFDSLALRATVTPVGGGAHTLAQHAVGYAENVASSPATGKVQLHYEGSFTRGDTLTFEGKLTRVAGATPTINFKGKNAIGGTLDDTWVRIKQRATE